MTTIAFIHHGDSAGNTASCLNIAGCLQRSGNRVLVLDLDPKGGGIYGLEAGRTSLVIDVSDVFVRGRDINGGGRFLSALDIKEIPTKNAGDGILSASRVVTTPESLSTAEGESKETRVEPVDLEDIAMIGQLTIEEGAASNAKVPNDRLNSQEGYVMSSTYHTPASKTARCRCIVGLDSTSNYHRRYVSQNRWGEVAEG